MRTLNAFLAGVWAVALACAAPALAQTPPAPAQLTDDQARVAADALFRRMLVKPDDLEAAFRFSELESRLGDYEAAIGALERMLFYNRDLPRVKLELGLLYFRLGSYEQARSYFDAAIAPPNTPEDVRSRVNTFLREIDRRLSTHQFAAFAQIGVRSQSNANAGANSNLVRALGFDATLDSKFARKRDTNVFAAARFTHIYDFENQRGDVWETNGALYAARQFRIRSLNLGVVELDTGPRLALGEANVLTVRPYAIGSVVTLGDQIYLGSAGAGLSARYTADYGFAVEPGVEIRARKFHNSTNYPTATDQQGNLATVFVSSGSQISFLPGLRWQGKLSYSRVSADNRAYSSGQFGGEISLPYEFDGPFGVAGRKWTLAPSVSWYRTSYSVPNPLVDPNVKRVDREWRVGTTLDMSLYENFGFAIQVQYAVTGSNLPNYRTRNFIVSGGPTVRF